MMVLRSSPKHEIFAVFVVAFLLLFHNNPYAVSAASCGRMGGSSFRESSEVRREKRYCTMCAGGSTSTSRSSSVGSDDVSALFPVIVVLILIAIVAVTILDPPIISILKIQVALSADARCLQRELTEIAFTTETSRKDGWHSILGGTTSLLLGQPDYFYYYGYSSVTSHKSNIECEQQFVQLSKKEQEKCEVESLVNVKGFTRQRRVASKAKRVYKDCIVITILVAVKGGHKLPTIRTTDDVKTALRYLRKISADDTKGLEVLWTPQDESDSLSAEEFFKNYPHLTRICSSWFFRPETEVH